MKPKVYITQEQPNLNYNKVEEFGEPVFITRHDYMSIDGTSHNKSLTEHIYSVMSKFDPKNDYIAPSGSPLVTGVAIAALAQHHEKISVLRWSNRDYTYYPFILEI